MDIALMATWVRTHLADRGESVFKNQTIHKAIETANREFSTVYPLRQKTILNIQKEVHKVSDTTQVIAAADATTQATANTLLNEIKADYNTHRASTTYHRAADTTNDVDDVTYPDATNLATSIVLVNGIKLMFNRHQILDGVHMVNDETNTITTINAVDLTTVLTLVNSIKAKYTAHLSEETNGLNIYASDVTDATGFIRVESLEYPVSYSPRHQPAFDRLGDWLHMKSDILPSDSGELVYCWWHKVHTLDTSTSTIPLEYEDTISLGAQGYALQIKALTERLQALTDVGSGRTALSSVSMTDAGAALTKSDDYLVDANTALDEAINYLDTDSSVNVKAFLTAIATDVASLRTKIRTANDAMATIGGDVDTTLQEVFKYLALDADVNVKDFLKDVTTDVAELRTKIRVATDAINSSLDEVDLTDFGTSEAVWSDQSKYVTGLTAPSVAKYLDDGDALINAATVGADVSKRYTEYAKETDNIIQAFNEKRKDALSQGQVRVNQALGYAEEIRSRMSDLRAYIEQAHGAYELVQGFVSKAEGHIRMGEVVSLEVQGRIADLRAYVEQAHGAYEIVQGFTQEALGRVRMSETEVQECVQRLDMNRIYISEGERYFMAAERQGVLADGFDTMATSKLREFRSQLKKVDSDRRNEEQPQTIFQNLWNPD